MTATVRTLDADLLIRDEAEVGEGPAWDERSQTLVWVDITGATVRRSTAAGVPLARIAVGRHVGAALPTDDDRLLLAVRGGFALLTADGTVEDLLEVEPDPSVRFNDAKCDPLGRAFAGTMAYDLRPHAGRLYRLDAAEGPRATPVLEPMTLSNGLAWSDDAGTMWVIDSGPRTVTAYAYDVDAAALGEVVARFEPAAPPGALPDGMCIDDDGALWIAVWGTGEVRRYAPDGTLDMIVRVPVSQVSSCCFGGAAGDVLFITSARHELSARQLADEPLAGSLFAVAPGVTGRAAVPWRAP
jgi:sugar lactone lactonase YvrE